MAWIWGGQTLSRVRIDDGTVQGLAGLSSLVVDGVNVFPTSNYIKVSYEGYSHYIPVETNGDIGTLIDNVIGIGARLSVTSVDVVCPNYAMSVSATSFKTTSTGTNLNSTLTSFVISGVSSLTLANYAFEGCSALTTVNILNSKMTSINQRVFRDCTALTSVSLPSTLTSIGNGVFRGTTALRSLVIPSNVTSIGTNCFTSSGVTSVTFSGKKTGWYHGSADISNFLNMSTPANNATWLKSTYASQAFTRVATHVALWDSANWAVGYIIDQGVGVAWRILANSDWSSMVAQLSIPTGASRVSTNSFTGGGNTYAAVMGLYNSSNALMQTVSWQDSFTNGATLSLGSAVKLCVSVLSGYYKDYTYFTFYFDN